MGYRSDLKDKDWGIIGHYFGTGKYGNRVIHSRRSLVNGILYVVKTGWSDVAEGFSAVEDSLWLFPSSFKAWDLGKSTGEFGKT